jgi:dinuclear metal center YbgI/SA1388 family protein
MKTPTVADMIRIMADIAPPALAEEWDNCGLQIGDEQWPAGIIRIALDPSLTVVETACRQHAGLLVTHHPLIFHPLKKLDFATPAGRVIRQAACHQMAIFSAHTNLDSVTDGVNDVLFEKLGLTHRSVLMPNISRPSEGLGRLGKLDTETDLKSFADAIRKRLALPFVRFVGKPDLPVRKVAICGGSGSGLLEAFWNSGADVFVTGDIRYHDARDAEALNRGLIDIGHFASEAIILDVLQYKIMQALSTEGLEAETAVCRVEKDPFVAVY